MPETLIHDATGSYIPHGGNGALDVATGTTTVVGNSAERVTPTLAAAKTGSLTTRTDNDTGTLTMDSGHGINTGATLDVYWSGGSRRGMTVGTVSGDSVPIDGGSGDSLPAAATAITAMVPTSIPFAVGGDTVVGLLLACGVAASVVFRTSAPGVIASLGIKAGGKGYAWASGSGVTNPLAGQTVATVLVSHADATGPQTVKAVAVFN